MTKLPLSHIYDVEADLLSAVKKWAEPQRANGIELIPIRDSYTIGYADLFISVKGWLVVAELKDRTGVTSPHQQKFIDTMNKTGAVGGVCRSVSDVAALVEEAKRRVAHYWESER